MAVTTTFTPPKNPDQPMRIQTQDRILVASFGDGYKQVTNDGLNYRSRTVDLTFSACTQAQRDSIVAFLELVGRKDAFNYTLPSDTVSRKWRVQNAWTEYRSTGDVYQISFPIEQAFDL